MSTAAQVAAVSRKASWTGRILSILIVLFMLFDAAIKLMKPASVVQGFAQLGWAANLVIPVGILALVCAILYAIPRTSVLGAILLTGYLGGAVATNVRIGLSAAVILAPAVFGALAWAALYLRDNRLRSLIPLRH